MEPDALAVEVASWFTGVFVGDDSVIHSVTQSRGHVERDVPPPGSIMESNFWCIWRTMDLLDVECLSGIGRMSTAVLGILLHKVPDAVHSPPCA